MWGVWLFAALKDLLSLHEDVLAAAVIGVSGEKWGERPLAVVVPVEGAEGRITADAMKEHLQEFVADGVIAKWAALPCTDTIRVMGESQNLTFDARRNFYPPPVFL